ncbi:MAG: diaminopimelate decarboxylase [Ruminococcaceae bacterium]|nr:diaminopimelate decarboxylase [Oscillospiraceae bacterium]
MLTSNSLKIVDNELLIGNVSTSELAKNFKTPLYVFDEEGIRKNCRAYVNSIKENYDGNGLVAYASKAFSCFAIYQIAKEEGLGIDVVSGGELYTAHRINFPMDKVFFHGNNKTKEELELAVKYRVGTIVVDNLTELKMLIRLIEKANKNGEKIKQRIMLRIKPGVDAHTHNFIRTGQIDSKFGFAVETNEATEAVNEALKYDCLDLVGIHCHIGSQIFDCNPFVVTAEIMMNFIADHPKANLRELNLGGGFGIKYKSDDKPIEYDQYMKKIATKIKEVAHERNIPCPKIIIEPGRSIIGSEGITLYTVGSKKVIPNVRTYIAVDGGMGDNPRYALYGAEYEFLCANKAGEPKTETVTIAGRYCESGDLLGENVKLQNVEPGDILAVLSTGAYNYSMASNYNRIPRPAVVLVNNGTVKEIIERETYEDIISKDVIL